MTRFIAQISFYEIIYDNRKDMKTNFVISSVLLALSTLICAQDLDFDELTKQSLRTEVYEPVPPVVTPGKTSAAAPSDAIILFNGDNLDAWTSEDPSKPAAWKVENGIITVDKSVGGIMTRQKFTDYQLHLEYRIPENISGEGQARGNSGVFLAYLGKKDGVFEIGYEVQILDNYNNPTYVNGQAGAVYKQVIPLANACRKPGEWQTYDIVWNAPRFKEDGTLSSPAYVTVIHNGVLVQNHAELKGQTLWIGEPFYNSHGAAPILLQAHGDPSEPISYRNIWLRPL